MSIPEILDLIIRPARKVGRNCWPSDKKACSYKSQYWLLTFKKKIKYKNIMNPKIKRRKS